MVLSAYAGKGGEKREDTGYVAFDRDAGRTDRGRDGGRVSRERQRAFLEKQLAADRDAPRGVSMGLFSYVDRPKAEAEALHFVNAGHLVAMLRARRPAAAVGLMPSESL